MNLYGFPNLSNLYELHKIFSKCPFVRVKEETAFTFGSVLKGKILWLMQKNFATTQSLESVVGVSFLICCSHSSMQQLEDSKRCLFVVFKGCSSEQKMHHPPLIYFDYRLEPFQKLSLHLLQQAFFRCKAACSFNFRTPSARCNTTFYCFHWGKFVRKNACFSLRIESNCRFAIFR